MAEKKNQTQQVAQQASRVQGGKEPAEKGKKTDPPRVLTDPDRALQAMLTAIRVRPPRVAKGAGQGAAPNQPARSGSSATEPPRGSGRAGRGRGRGGRGRGGGPGRGGPRG